MDSELETRDLLSRLQFVEGTSVNFFVAAGKTG